MVSIPDDLRAKLGHFHQEHLLMGWEKLNPEEQSHYLAQLQALEFDQIAELYRQKDHPLNALPAPDRIEPIPVEQAQVSASDLADGEAAFSRGEIAALLVAGGQGSRLGFDKPKGMYPIGPVSRCSLFQVHAEKVLALSRRYGKPIPLGVMTSPATDADTKAFFELNDYFGLNRAEVCFFQQGTMPALDLATGKILLEKPGQLFLSPNGHGGTLTALNETGLLGEWKAKGVKHVFYFQVDNPLVKVCSPSFIARHIVTGSEASSKVVFKEKPEEKVGILAVVDGRCGIIEYSDMTAQMQAEREVNGALRFRAGSPAIHAFSIPFLERVTARGTGLAFHTARKKVAHYDPTSKTQVTPVTENALKFEMFVFDALPMAERWLAVETPRSEEFAPLKNASGADSAATVAQAWTSLHAGWLEDAGVTVSRNSAGESLYSIEISPLFALDAQELKSKVNPAMVITQPFRLA